MTRGKQPTLITSVAPIDPTPYATLTPDRILNVIEALGYCTDSRLLALNSYENRVYRVGLEEAPALVAKFYRPGRWSDEAILEEHAFALELARAEIPVVPPLVTPTGETLHRADELRFALYPNRPGRQPELDDGDVLRWIGRFIGRIHSMGKVKRFRARKTLTAAEFGHAAVTYIKQSKFLPSELIPAYESVTAAALEAIDLAFANCGPLRQLRLHGDCHPGNILWTPAGPHFVDFDDCMMGPAIQDLWMLLAGDREDSTRQLEALLSGYEAFCVFDPSELSLIEPLRTLRIIHYTAWLARRWDDPAFPLNFPWFNTQRYWQDHILTLREQLGAMQEPTLVYMPVGH